MKLDKREWLSLIMIILGGSTIYKVVFLSDIFYSSMKDTLNLTHTQMGNLITAFAVTQLISYIPGGWITDIISIKILIPSSLFLTSICGFWMSTLPSYNELLIIQALQGFTITLLFWQAMIKGVRLLGTSDQQGRLFGLLEGGRGLGGTIVNLLALYVFSTYLNNIDALKTVILFYSLIMLVLSILSYFILKPSDTKTEVKPMEALKGLYEVSKMPKVWVAGLIIFFGYSFYCGLRYFGPYSTEVLKFTNNQSTFLNIMRQNVVPILIAPIAGLIADKMGSTIKFLKVVYIIGFVLIVMFVALPGQSTYLLPLLFMVLLAAVVSSLRATYYSTTDEMNIPLAKVGSVAGIMSLLGNTDVFIFTLFGYILDSFSEGTGYAILFLTMGLFALLGLICSIILRKMLNKEVVA